MSNKITWVGEVGQNHNGNIRVAGALARELIEQGVDYVKFQAYDCTTLFTGEEKFYSDSCNAELTKSQMFLLYELVNHFKGRILFSAFDLTRINWVMEADLSIYPFDKMTPFKLASRVANFKPILELLKSMNESSGYRPIKLFVSHGMKNMPNEYYKDIAQEVHHLFCKSEYPCTYTDEDWVKFGDGISNGTIDGLSDHSIGTAPIEKAINLGAKIIEKHITFNRDAPGPDHKLSLLTSEFGELIKKYK